MFDVTVNLQGVVAGLRGMMKVDGRKVFRDARKPFRADLRDHAVKQTDSDGKWAPRAPATKERMARGRRGKRRRGGRLLGRLPGAMTVTIGADFIRGVSRVAWSQSQNKGGRVGNGSRLPARRFAWLGRTIVRQVRDLWNQALKRAWEAGR